MRQSAAVTPAGGSSASQNYVWDNGGTLPLVVMDGTNAYVYTTGQAPAEQVKLSGGTVTYLTTDSLGSVRGTVSSSGALTAVTSYDAWGNPQTAGGLTATTPYGYAGGYTDADGLVYLLARYYSPATGQFLSVDPDISQTGQPYAYADGNPVANDDPTGDLYLPLHFGHRGWTELYFYFSDYSTALIAAAGPGLAAQLRNAIMFFISRLPSPIPELMTALIDKMIEGGILEAKRIAGYTEEERDRYLHEPKKETACWAKGGSAAGE